MSFKSISNSGNSVLVTTGDKLSKEIDKVNDSIRLERRKYNTYSIIKDVAMNCTTEESDLPSELRSKVFGILNCAEIEQCLKLTSDDTLLGLSSTDTELTYEEKEQIKEAVQHGIIHKSRKLFEELEELGIECTQVTDLTCSVLNLSVEDRVLMDYKRELNEKQDLYILRLEELISIFKEFLELKSIRLPKSVNDNVHACEVQLRLCELQSQVMSAKSRVDIFIETKNSLDAYRELLKDISQQQTDCKKDIEQLLELKEKYKQVSCKQYNEILRRYIKYKSIIDNRKDFLNQK